MKYILLCTTALLCTASCKSHLRQYTNKGTVEGIDTTGACGGKYILHIYEDSNTNYRFFAFPKGMDPDTVHFPIPVYFNYTETKVCGDIHLLTIKDMEKRRRNAYGDLR